MNYEVDMYVEAHRRLPSRDIILNAKDGDYYHFKSDILAGMITYSTDKNGAANLVTISKDRASEIIKMNKKGQKPDKINIEIEEPSTRVGVYKNDILEDESITRFDSNSNSQTRKKRNPRRRNQNNPGRNRNPRKNNSSGESQE